MIQLFIGDTELVLPASFGFTEIDENSLLTEAGEYTLDFELSLKSRINARVFGHANRTNAQNKQTSYDNARKVIDGAVSHGRIIILSREGDKIKCQYVAGASNVNYQIKDDRKIWELDFGTESEITFELAMRSIKYPGYGHKRIVQPPFNWVVEWDNNYACVPVKFSNVVANDYKLPEARYNTTYNTLVLRHLNGVDETVTTGSEIPVEAVENIVMQPYLLYYINKLPELLGFTMGVNVLNEDTKILKKILVNRVQSLKYSDALPDMTIREFISAIEYGYNVVFDFRNDNTLHIINTKQFIDSKQVITPTLLDAFQEEPAEDVYRFDVTSLGYDLGSSEFSKYQKLDEELVEKCSFMEFSNLTALKSYANDTVINNFALYRTANRLNEYLITSEPSANVYRTLAANTPAQLIAVNKFQNYKEEGGKEIELNIIPSPVTNDVKKLELIQTTGSGLRYTLRASYQLPSVASELYVIGSQNVLEAVESSLEVVPRSSKIEIVLYNGLIKLPALYLPYAPAYFSIIYNVKYPFTFIDDMPEYWLTTEEKDQPANSGGGKDVYAVAGLYEAWVSDYYRLVCTDTLRITNSAVGIWTKYYSQRNSYVDTSTIYTRYFPPKQTLTSNYIYYIDGNKYIPISFERQRKSDGPETAVVGKFYRLK